MQCPFCQNTSNKVLDSRLTPDSDSIRRRRECEKCDRRFTTYERAELFDIMIVKKDGRREPFSRDKIMRGIMRACEKRPVKTEKIENVVNRIESSLRQSDKEEIKARKIGEMRAFWGTARFARHVSCSCRCRLFQTTEKVH